ncbi:hypothetical protein GLI01_34160 [Gluconacetobacter liquefaciens]|uniref:Uncharacterized protein n=1 Tax=Gluconacetobacter liquefaciens TaxID=89584 RepID=A0A370FZY5_GLULI|nr:hypothetical protein [Gluconacetobacter liquefaciens]MBB2188087.1 hypothetical protein [Gluconacetobacter liquefaciens]RDI36199.1 hypothetical protein C7453_11280 [Gluconacetobacter liquefaciens]GBR11222.1 hypothetical protein AA0522_2464 [Gluconacetobacter liquefaciens NRIC 0522]GEB39381.1 hypothetical protein GLI01_34160 [Gluconacetobacter liquefaciens]
MKDALNPEATSFISQSELLALGIKVRKGTAPSDRGGDLLQRFIEVPNRLVIAYSSDDESLCNYITEHWSALDGMSGKWCDIYLSMLQMSGDEDVYSAMSDLRMLPGGEALRVNALPIALLWSAGAAACISLREFSTSKADLTKFFRHIFQFLSEINGGLTGGDEEALRSTLVSALPKVQPLSGYSFFVENIEMNDHKYIADRGGVVVGAGASAGNIIANYGSQLNSFDLPLLASQLKQLRGALKKNADDNDSTHDVAIGQIATAAKAAEAGERGEVFAALKNAGSWALGIAQTLGVSAATEAIKHAMNS